MQAIKITTKDGEVHEIDPVISITVDNSFHDYEFDANDITHIEIVEEK